MKAKDNIKIREMTVRYTSRGELFRIGQGRSCRPAAGGQGAEGPALPLVEDVTGTIL
jgi:hypothetical protein